MCRFTDVSEEIPMIQRCTAAQKATHLEMMLGQIASYAPINFCNTIICNSTLVNRVWQAIRQHYGFQSIGSHILDLPTSNLNLINDQKICIKV